jgi:hypothetical protein
MVKHDAGRYHRQKRELKDSQLSEIRDSFELFDQDGLGTVQATDLVRASAGRRPAFRRSLAQLTRLPTRERAPRRWCSSARWALSRPNSR